MDYREAMREFVGGISSYAKALDPSFLVIPQNGHELLTEDGTPSGAPVKSYIASIDGIGREDLFYGYAGDNEPTPGTVTAAVATVHGSGGDTWYFGACHRLLRGSRLCR